MNSRWQTNRIGLINFWYYDEQEFPFVKGRMLLRGSNGSGKSVTMQSVVPLLLDGNMSPERLDPFGSKDRKMSSYLLEEDDGREERTGYLYLEFKRKDSDTYITIGMGIRARRGKPLDKWYFSITDERRIGKDFYLYKDIGDKVTLSKKELENRIADGGRVFERQAEYMEYVNRQIFGFETVEEYKELVDLLIQLRTPKLSKDFKPSVINDILSSSLQPLSDDDLRPMSEAIENMDTMNTNLKSRREAKQAAEKINTVFNRYNKIVLYNKATKYMSSSRNLYDVIEEKNKYEVRYEECKSEIEKLNQEIQHINNKKDVLEKEKETLNKSDAVALKIKENELLNQIREHKQIAVDKNKYLESKEEQYRDAKKQIKDEEDRKYEKEKEIEELLEYMSEEAEQMSFQEFAFMKDELSADIEKRYIFSLHRQQFEYTKNSIKEGEILLKELKQLDKEKEEMIKKREQQIRELDTIQRKITELEALLVQVENEWKEKLYKWNEVNTEFTSDREFIGELSHFADNYNSNSDYSEILNKVSEKWIEKKSQIGSIISTKNQEYDLIDSQLKEIKLQLSDWENMKEPQPERTEAVLKNRTRLQEAGIPYQEFYKVLEFNSELDEEVCNHLEEALLKMGILDAIVVDEEYKSQVLSLVTGCEDRYLFTGNVVKGKSLLDVLELNEEINDIFSNRRLTDILRNIAYDCDDYISVSEDGLYRMGVLYGTVTGEYKAGYLGTRARERQRLAKIDECKSKIIILEEQMHNIKQECELLEQRKDTLDREFHNLPKDDDMKAALRMLLNQEYIKEQLQTEHNKLNENIQAFMEKIKEKRKIVLEIADKLYLSCSYDVFGAAENAADNYDKNLVKLQSAHELFLRSVESINERKEYIDNLDFDIEQVRYDIKENAKQLNKKTEERESILKQLELTDYEAIKEHLDECIQWLSDYPDKIDRYVTKRTRLQSETENIEKNRESITEKIKLYEKETKNYLQYYNQECELGYVDIPDEISENVNDICEYLSDVKNIDKDSVVNNLNQVYFENRSFLTDYQLAQGTLFDTENEEMAYGYSAKRLDISARYQGVKVTFANLLIHLEEDINELENLIKDGDRELFEDILANTVGRKIRGKINASNTWVQKMNNLMNKMDTSSGLRLSLRWRSKTAEKEDQLDTRELVELLKKDYRLMSEDEAARLSSHFRSKVDEARRSALDSNGMTNFYQIMKETLDYRKWFEFQLFSQKNGEKQKELTNSVFGTFSGGEKAMSMYVPLFSAVVAKYQGGRNDAPRLVSLDEAFAGVDNRNIRDMFRLMTQFEFDFIINSQVLWGDCDTLDALAIYQLVRPENAKFVTVMPYLWNGHSKELLDDEEKVEQRGMQISNGT